MPVGSSLPARLSSPRGRRTRCAEAEATALPARAVLFPQSHCSVTTSATLSTWLQGPDTALRCHPDIGDKTRNATAAGLGTFGITMAARCWMRSHRFTLQESHNPKAWNRQRCATSCALTLQHDFRLFCNHVSSPRYFFNTSLPRQS